MTLIEMRQLMDDTDLRNKVESALIIEAGLLLEAATPTLDEKKWASSIYNSPQSQSLAALRAVLAANKSATQQQVKDATDVTIQSNVNGIVDTLVEVSATI